MAETLVIPGMALQVMLPASWIHVFVNITENLKWWSMTKAVVEPYWLGGVLSTFLPLYRTGPLGQTTMDLEAATVFTNLAMLTTSGPPRGRDCRPSILKHHPPVSTWLPSLLTFHSVASTPTAGVQGGRSSLPARSLSQTFAGKPAPPAQLPWRIPCCIALFLFSHDVFEQCNWIYFYSLIYRLCCPP